MAGGNIASRLGLSEFTKTGGIWKCLLAEFIGNMLLNFFGCASCVNIDINEPGNRVLISLTFGFIIMVIVQTIGHISGGHVNPAVTCAFLITGKMTILKGLCYIIFQCLGSITGSAILMALTPEEAQKTLGMTALGGNGSVSPVQGFGIEFFLGFVLVFVIFGVCDSNKPECKGFAPITIGLTIAMGHLAAVDYTGSSMNPARTLGSAVVINMWDNHWIYWLGPILGGMTAALIYTHALTASEPIPSEPTDYTPVHLKRMDGIKDADDRMA